MWHCSATLRPSPTNTIIVWNRLTGIGSGSQQPEHLIAKLPPGKYTFRVQATHGSKSGVVHTLSVYYHSSSVVAVYHCLHCIYRMYYPDRGWHHLMVQTPQGETTGRTAKAVRDRKGEGTVRTKVDFFTEIAHEVRTL